ncbi:hypothetical protein ACFQ5D_09420 [Paenibacillus farraposensis]|uniref:Uncharacterized protein n=1 Tax=Paenibacillus farraposensis TaxID=2807095 RepID=A0ABW4DF85_9BACL|nr:hypothetical protein [Paenibacillus farraposensis]MCC3379862.1 hypothetical protein [Paenibacillus farraposensis]
MKQITQKHLTFLKEAAEAFEGNDRWETYTNEEKDLIALRYGVDRDCIKVIELGDEVAFFAQMISSSTTPRQSVHDFYLEMERQLQANDHRGGWENRSIEALAAGITKNFGKLWKCRSHEEFRRRCANIANFTMMMYENDRREEAERK